MQGICLYSLTSMFLAWGSLARTLIYTYLQITILTNHTQVESKQAIDHFGVIGGESKGHVGVEKPRAMQKVMLIKVGVERFAMKSMALSLLEGTT